MLLVALHFWNTSTNSLHLKCGLFTLTLLDVAAIIALKPTGETFDHDLCESDFFFDFDTDRAVFGNYIEDQHIQDKEGVSDEEHIAFLTFWLYLYDFCTRSIQVAKQYSLNQGVADIRDQVKSLIIPGPIWLI